LLGLSGPPQVTVDDLMAMANETAQVMEYSSQLEIKSEELSRTARQLREANQKLTTLSVQKDAFLSQVSHELRTPMTSIRAFSEILRETGSDGRLDSESLEKFSGIIHDETLRLTRLLDDLLDLSVLENLTVSLDWQTVRVASVLETAILAQVFINLIANAQKYCTASNPMLTIKTRTMRGGALQIDFIDNGEGIPAGKQEVIFEKFSRLSDQSHAGGAGLGLAICKEIVHNLGGTITYLPGQGGAAFRIVLPQNGR